MPRRYWLVPIMVLSTAWSTPLPAQAPILEARLARALAALDSTETERGIELLRELVRSLPPDAPQALRVRAHLHLGAASWSLGLGDSAAAHFSETVRASPFAQPNPEIFNPDVLAAFRAARRGTLTVGLRVATDTVIKPDVDSYLVAVAVGRPGDVNVLLRRTDGPAPASVETRLRVDSVSSFVLSLRVSDGLALEPGDYRLSALLQDAPGDSATTTLRITRPAVDTAAHEPPLDSSLFRPEMRKGPPVPTSALLGMAFGAAAAAVPMVLGNKDLGGGKAQVPALSVGLGISVAGIAGVVLGRRMVPIHENIQYNRSLVTAREQRNRAIAEANEHKRRLAPLRITVVEEHP